MLPSMENRGRFAPWQIFQKYRKRSQFHYLLQEILQPAAEAAGSYM